MSKLNIPTLTLITSIAIHVSMFAAIHSYNISLSSKPPKMQTKVAVVVTKKELPPPPPPPPPPQEEVKKKDVAPPKPAKNMDKKQPIAKESKPKAQPTEPPKQIQGLSKDSFSDKGTGGFSAPAGNSMTVPDEGIRKKEVEAITEDLSTNAKLDLKSFKYPEYTDDAIDASLEGNFEVDVFVDANGNATEVELRKKIGYGMDERLIAAVKTAKFSPRRDQKGIAITGWTTIRINLIIP